MPPSDINLVHEPLDGRMVPKDSDTLAQEIQMELLACSHNGQALAVSDTVVLLGLAELV